VNGGGEVERRHRKGILGADFGFLFCGRVEKQGETSFRRTILTLSSRVTRLGGGNHSHSSERISTLGKKDQVFMGTKLRLNASIFKQLGKGAKNTGLQGKDQWPRDLAQQRNLNRVGKG